MFDRNGEYEDVVVVGEQFDDLCADGSLFFRCEFRGVSFLGASMSGAQFDRCRFDSCDLSNADLSTSTLDSVLFRESKLLGVNLANATVRSMQASGCFARMLSVFRAAVRDTTFSGCDLTEADFRESRLVNTAVVDCDLSSALFGHGTASRFDIRGSVLNGSFSLAHAKGFVVSSEQVLMLASALAEEAGATLNDDVVEHLDDLPGGREVSRLAPVDPEVAQRGLSAARAALEQRERPSDRPF